MTALVSVRFLGRPALLSTDFDTGRRLGNSYCRGAGIAASEELLASLLTDSVSTSVPLSTGCNQQLMHLFMFTTIIVWLVWRILSHTVVKIQA